MHRIVELYVWNDVRRAEDDEVLRIERLTDGIHSILVKGVCARSRLTRGYGRERSAIDTACRIDCEIACRYAACAVGRDEPLYSGVNPGRIGGVDRVQSRVG